MKDLDVLARTLYGEAEFGKPRFIFKRGGKGISIVTREVDPGKIWEIELSINDKIVSSSLSDRITIIGDDDEGPTANVRLVVSKLTNEN